MDATYWQQQKAEPLYPDLLWSRPENRLHAGKLLIIGGNVHSFAAVAEAYQAAEASGAGTTHVILPDALQKTVGPLLDNVTYVPSTPSGSFGQQALNELLRETEWADGVLIAADLGRNSETAILLEKYVTKSNALLTLTKDAVDYFTTTPTALAERANVTLVLSIAQLQKLAAGLHTTKPLTFAMELLQLVGWLHDFSNQFPIHIVTKHHDQLLVATGGQVSSTKISTDEEDSWRVKTAAAVSVWWLQNSGKPFEALTTAIYSTKSAEDN